MAVASDSGSNSRRCAAVAAAVCASFVVPGADPVSLFVQGAPSASALQASTHLRGQDATTAAPQFSSAASTGSVALGVSAVAAASVVAGRVSGAALARRTVKPSKVCVAAFENELGVQAPVGFWDPLGLAASGSVDDFRRRRGVELKHGRISMLACIGYIVPEYFKWPGFVSPSQAIRFTDIPNGLGAFSKIPFEGWLQMVLFVGHYEGQFFRQDPKRAPGDFENYGYFGIGKNFIFNFEPLTIADEAEKTKKLSIELANGRLAMVAIMAMFFQNGTVGSTSPEMWLPKAFESELGVQAPVGFWDPLGLAASGDADDFRRRRGVELKHGRVSMLACIGYIVPEYFKWPGFVSPSQAIRFTDIPNGLGALSKIPFEGWLQMVLFVGHYEGQFFRQDPKRAPGDFENYGYFGIGKNFIFNVDPLLIEDEAKKKEKLSIELANGRLAMVAIMAMFFQNGTVGSTSPEMWLPKAFESELGVQAPVGFWDPLGLAAAGDADDFRRRRGVELKHGRVSMLACIGYIVPEYFKWPGFVSPSQAIRFTDIPNGLGALSKIPFEGWLQMVLFVGHYEGQFFRQDPKRAPGDFENYGYFGIGKNFIFNFDPLLIEDEAKKKEKLSIELANGRLAMVAIMAMFFQNGTVGSTSPEMWLPK